MTDINDVVDVANLLLSYFEVTFFCLSQQVLVIAIVSSVILRAFVRENNVEIWRLMITAKGSFKREHQLDVVPIVTQDAERETLIYELEKIRRRQAKTVILNKNINACFGYCLVAAFLLDQCTTLGNIARAMTSTRTGADTNFWSYIATTVVLFAFYSVALSWSYVQAHEEVGTQNMKMPCFEKKKQEVKFMIY